MPAAVLAMISRVTTADVAPRDRIGFWEDYNRTALVGLSCTSFSERGLLADQANFVLGGVRLADISGNAHAVERTPHAARAMPKDSVFATPLVEGDAVFMHERAHEQLTGGGAAAGTTIADIAYRWGFSSQAHFARRYRARFGGTPGEARGRAGR